MLEILHQYLTEHGHTTTLHQHHINIYQPNTKNKIAELTPAEEYHYNPTNTYLLIPLNNQPTLEFIKNNHTTIHLENPNSLQQLQNNIQKIQCSNYYTNTSNNSDTTPNSDQTTTK